MKYKVISGWQNTDEDGEDFAITPYIGLVLTNCETIKALGLSICWGYRAVFIAIATGVPKGFPFFKKYP